MERIFRIIVIFYIFGISYACDKKSGEKCKTDEDCCSGICYIEEKEEFGVCDADGCKPIISEKIKISCTTASNKRTSCNKSLRANSTAMPYGCNLLYNLKGNPNDLLDFFTKRICKNGNWDPPLNDDVCQESIKKAKIDECKPLISKIFEIECFTRERKETSCNETLKANSTAFVIGCQDPYDFKGGNEDLPDLLQARTCQDGKWYPPLLEDQEKLCQERLIQPETPSPSTNCEKNWDETCKTDNDCCSGVCYKEPKERFGICGPDECKPLVSKKLQVTCFTPDRNAVPCSEDLKTGSTAIFDECTPVSLRKLRTFCFTSFNETTSCDKPFKPKSKIIFRCNYPNYGQTRKPEYNQITCNNGQWDRPLLDDFCTVECGQSLTDVATPYISHGKVAEVTKFPWHAGIYEFESGKYDQKCGETLISPKIVISAAHCFTISNLEKRDVDFKDVSILKVAFGKLYRSIDASEDKLAQIKDVDSVEIPSKYKELGSLYEGDIAFVILKDEVEYSWVVVPICIDVEENGVEKYQLVKGAQGKVAGWGIVNGSESSSSEKLPYTEMHFIPLEECENLLDRTWHTYLRDDKFCLSANENQSVTCQGDSGGGLVFPDPVRKTEYYLRGIVSLGPKCDSGEGFALFTNLSSYKELVDKYV